jgi:hypothetical protein
MIPHARVFVTVIAILMILGCDNSLNFMSRDYRYRTLFSLDMLHSIRKALYSSYGHDSYLDSNKRQLLDLGSHSNWPTLQSGTTGAVIHYQKVFLFENTGISVRAKIGLFKSY